MHILTEPQIHQLLDEYEGREYHDGMIGCGYEFDDFVEAIGFVNDIAGVAEEMKHHPHIEIDFNRVLVTSTTHDAENQVTDKDVELMKKVEQLVD